MIASRNFPTYPPSFDSPTWLKSYQAVSTSKTLYFLALVLIAIGAVIAIPSFLTWMHIIFSNTSFESIRQQAGSIFFTGIIGSLLMSFGAGLWKTSIALDSKTEIRVNANNNNGIMNLLGTIIGNVHNSNKRK